MRLVIIGEFSSFAKNLSAGFRALGHECFVFSWGDGFKKITQEGDSYTVNARYKGKGKINFLKYMVRSTWEFWKLKRVVRNMSKKERWDVVLIINAGFVKKQGKFWQANFTEKMIKSLLVCPENIYLSSCGGDVPFFDFWPSQNWKNKEHAEMYKARVLSKAGISHFNYLASFVNKVIPISYSYAEPWRNSEYSKSFTICPTIPLPVDTKKHDYYNKIEDKIVVFHGIIRPKSKGTNYILPAMQKLQEKYPDKVECIAKGGMSLDEYLDVLSRTNIVIDQVYASTAGMNGLYILAKGKVLLGGNEPENAKEYGQSYIPIINIGPDTDQIFLELEKLILHPEDIIRLSKEGREYVEKVHESKVVAKKYVEIFNKYNKRETKTAYLR